MGIDFWIFIWGHTCSLLDIIIWSEMKCNCDTFSCQRFVKHDFWPKYWMIYLLPKWTLIWIINIFQKNVLLKMFYIGSIASCSQLCLTTCQPRNSHNIAGLDKQNFSVYNCKYFLTHRFKHMFWVLKRIVSLRRFLWVPTTYVLVEK